MDLLVCPEMFLTGYMFTSSADIKPFLEPPRIGRTSLFCRELATRYQCWVVGGYPELATGEGEEGKPGYNSAVLVSPTGEVMGNYRKSFLYDTDKTWAREGESSFVSAWSKY
jgi:protein N-terminal amidase